MDKIALTRDAIDLFSHRRGGHVEGWLYADPTGAQFWRDVLATEKYDFPNRDRIVIESALPALSTHFTHIDTIVDCGVGDAFAVSAKALPIVKGCPNAKTYVGIDGSAEFLKDATNIIQQDSPRLNVQSIQADFFKQTITIRGKNKLGLLFGSTISNVEMLEGEAFPRQKIIDYLSVLKQTIGKNGQLLVSFDSNPDLDDANQAYSTPQWEKFVMNYPHLLAKHIDIKGGFDPDAWCLQRPTDKSARTIHHCIAATKTQPFKIAGHPFNIAAGERFPVINVFRYTVPSFHDLSHGAGLSIGNLYTDVDKYTNVQHLST